MSTTTRLDPELELEEEGMTMSVALWEVRAVGER